MNAVGDVAKVRIYLLEQRLYQTLAVRERRCTRPTCRPILLCCCAVTAHDKSSRSTVYQSLNTIFIAYTDTLDLSSGPNFILDATTSPAEMFRRAQGDSLISSHSMLVSSCVIALSTTLTATRQQTNST